jgi:hypothetical protein
VRVDIRPLVNGLPQSFEPTDPKFISIVDASDVNTSLNASVLTKFTFDEPLYLEEDRDYCFVVFSNSKRYNLFTSKLGETSLETGRQIFEQPYNGSLFKSENNITWQPEQFEDIKFNLNIAKFDTTLNSIVKLKAVSDFFGVSGQYISTINESNVIRVKQTTQHGLDVSSKIFVVADVAAVYNGIPAANIAGQRNVTFIVDDYTYFFNADSPATMSGQILTGGQVREIQVDFGGSGYTSIPTVTITGGGGTGASATSVIAGRAINNIVITDSGTNYSSPPEVVITRTDGSTGVDAIATSVLTTFNSEISANRGTALSRYITKKFTLETPSTGINLFSEIYSEQQSGVDWYIRTSKSGTTENHDNLEWKILLCDVDRNRSSKRGEVFDYKFYRYGLQEFDVYELKCVMRSSNPSKAPEVNNYRAIIVA